jgi:hypothetical protein
MSLNRRKLIQIAALGSAAFVIQACTKKSEPEANVSGELGAGQPAAGEKPLELVPETDATVVALGYKHDAAQVDASLKTEKNGTAGNLQNCANCAFYAPLAGVEGGGKCQLIMSGYVKSQGWCKSWSLKQG